MHRKNFFSLFLAMLCLSSTMLQAACPFCAAVSQTLRQEIEAMDGAAIGKLVPDDGKTPAEEGIARFQIVEIIKGNELLKIGQVVSAPYFGKSTADSRFLLLGVDPPELMWSSPLPVSERAQKYIREMLALPADMTERLKFFQQYFEDSDSVLARDSYDEFANASYEEVKKLKPFMSREKLLGWISNTELSPDRKRLYLTLLGVCGNKEDTALLEELMRSSDPAKRTGMDAMIGCYLTLKGADGLALVEELFLKNKKCEFADVYAAIMALRFHGTDGGVIDRSRVVESMHYVLDRPELADLVIPDLARWEDWSQIDRLVELFKKSDENTSWVRVPVINYLRSCPLPAAKEKLAELEKIDPVAAKRAATFFPMPNPSTATPGKAESSRFENRKPKQFKLDNSPDAIYAQAIPGNRTAKADSIRRLTPEQLAARFGYLPSASTRPSSMNPITAASVTAMAGTTLWLTMWLTISGLKTRRSSHSISRK
jgi:hypothetical protein